MRRLHLCLAGAAFSVGLTLGLLLPAYAALTRTPDITTTDRDIPTAVQSPLDSTTNGVYWSAAVERLLPTGFTDEDLRLWRRFVNDTDIARVDSGCGRMQNRLVTFSTGQRSCGRYRQNNDQIQGEIFSYYLSRLLALRNLPPAVLSVTQGPRWTSVGSHLQLASWNPERPVVLTQFIDGLTPAFIPPAFRNASRRLHPPDVASARSTSELKELAQWSDLIVFDYLTANLDRVVNNMFNEQWNAAMMRSPGHNLVLAPDTGLLLFLDNESGLLHGYRLLDKYESYHVALLHSLCLFREPTIRHLRRLRTADIGRLLREELRREPAGARLPNMPERYLKVLRQRLDTVDEHVRTCERRYGPQ